MSGGRLHSKTHATIAASRVPKVGLSGARQSGRQANVFHLFCSPRRKVHSICFEKWLVGDFAVSIISAQI